MPKQPVKNPRKPRLTPEDLEKALDLLALSAIGKQGVKKYSTELKIWQQDLKHNLDLDINDATLAKYLSARWLQLKTHSCLKTSLAFIFRLLLLRGKPGYNRKSKHQYPCLNSAVEAIHSNPDYVKDDKEDEFVEFTVDDCILLLNSLWGMYFDVRNEKWVSLNDEAVQLAAVIVLCCFCSFRADDLSLLYCYGVSFSNNEDGVFECTVRLTNPHGCKEVKNAKKKNSRDKHNRTMQAVITCACTPDVQTTYLMNPMCGAHIMFVMMESMDDNQGDLRVLRNVNAASHRFTTQNMGARRISNELAQKMNNLLPESYNGRVNLTLKHLKQTGISLKTKLCGGDMDAVKVTSRHLTKNAANTYVRKLQQDRDKDVMREVSNRLNNTMAIEGVSTAAKHPQTNIIVQAPRNAPTVSTHTIIPRDILEAVEDNTNEGRLETASIKDLPPLKLTVKKSSLVPGNTSKLQTKSAAVPTVVTAPEPSATPAESAAVPTVVTAPEPSAVPAESAAVPTVVTAPEPSATPAESAAVPTVVTAPEPSAAPAESAAVPTVVTAPEPSAVPAESAAVPTVVTAPEPSAAPAKPISVPTKVRMTQPRLPPTKPTAVPTKVRMTQPRLPPTKPTAVPTKITMTQPRLPPSKFAAIPSKVTMTQPRYTTANITTAPTKLTMTQPCKSAPSTSTVPTKLTVTQSSKPTPIITTTPSKPTVNQLHEETIVTASHNELDDYDDSFDLLSPHTAEQLTQMVEEAEKSYETSAINKDLPIDVRSPKPTRFNPVLRLTPKPKKPRKKREPLQANKPVKKRKTKHTVPLAERRNVFDHDPNKENVPPVESLSVHPQSQSQTTTTTHNKIVTNTPPHDNVDIESVEDVSPTAQTTTTKTHIHIDEQKTQESKLLQQKDEQLKALQEQVAEMQRQLQSRPTVQTVLQPSLPTEVLTNRKLETTLSCNTNRNIHSNNNDTNIMSNIYNNTETPANFNQQLVALDTNLLIQHQRRNETQVQPDIITALLAQQQQQMQYMQLLQKNLATTRQHQPDQQQNQQSRDTTNNHGCTITNNYYRL